MFRAALPFVQSKAHSQLISLGSSEQQSRREICQRVTANAEKGPCIGLVLLGDGGSDSPSPLS